jgi:hypothetical protein
MLERKHTNRIQESGVGRGPPIRRLCRASGVDRCLERHGVEAPDGGASHQGHGNGPESSRQQFVVRRRIFLDVARDDVNAGL